MSRTHRSSLFLHPLPVSPPTRPARAAGLDRSIGTQVWILGIATLALILALITTKGQAQVIDRWFTVQPIRVYDDAGLNPAPIPMFQAETEKIFAQAGVAPIWLPTTQINDSSMLVVSTVDDVNVPGNGQHVDPLTINMWFVEDLDIGPDWILFGEAYINGNGVVINGTDVETWGGGRIDTIAHELGHNMWLEHSTLGAGGGDNLMTAGEDRDAPGDISHITPDGDDLSQLTASQITQVRASPFLGTVAEVLVDTNGSTPYNTDDFFLVEFASGPLGMSLTSLTMDLSPVAAFLDPTVTDPGAVGTPFAVNAASMVGVNAADITVSGDADGSQLLTLDFAADTFTEGDSFRFGIDVDLFTNIDGYGATPEELMGTLFTFEFDTGLLSEAEIEADLIASSIEPIKSLRFSDYNIVRQIEEPFQWELHPDPIRAVPEPASVLLFGLSLMFALAPIRSKRQIVRTIKSGM